MIALEERLDSGMRVLQPYGWAVAQSNMGHVATLLGDADSLGRAAQAYDGALEEIRPEDAPLFWAEIKFNLGRVLASLGGILDDRQHLERAVAVWEEALGRIGRLECGPAAADLAYEIGRTARNHNLYSLSADGYRAAAEWLQRMRLWEDWDKMQVELVRLGLEQDDRAIIEGAASVYLRVLEGSDGPTGLSESQAWFSLGWVWRNLGVLVGEEWVVYNGKSIVALQNGLDALPSEERGETRAIIGDWLGREYLERYYVVGDREALSTAIGLLQESAAIQDSIGAEASQVGETYLRLGAALLQVGRRERGTERLEAAERALSRAVPGLGADQRIWSLRQEVRELVEERRRENGPE